MQRIRIALLTTALLNSIAAWCQPFNGIMMGINGGITQAQVRTQQQATFNLPIAPLFIQVSNGDSSKVNDTSGTWGIMVGYAQTVTPCWLLGVEGRAQSARLNMTQQFGVTTQTGGSVYAPFGTSVSTQQQYAILAKLGYLLDQQNLVYGLIGPAWSKVDIAANAEFQISFSPPPMIIESDLALTQSRYHWGYAVGLGMEHEICSQLSLGLEYQFTDFGSLKYPGVTASVFALNGMTAPGSYTELDQAVHLRNNQIVLRATYYLPIL